MDRRSFLGSAAVAGTLAMLPSMARGAQALGQPVEISTGKVRGFITEGVNSFRGIPYGTARRFREAVPPPAWTGIFDALGWGYDAPQGARENVDNIYSLSGSDISLQIAQDESCLALNIWTPGLNDKTTRPVMVWLHGGGFVSGSASTAVHDGTNLARHGDVVVVSLNHRLNVFGFTYFDNPDYAASANAGVTDIRLALRWIRDNIAQFGGDPSNITLFGYSGGGQKIATLMAMPSAKGLFHRAIIQSGQNPHLLELDAAAANTHQLFSWLGLKQGDIESLQAIPTKQMIRAFTEIWAAPPAQRWGFPARFSPVIDGVTIPAHPVEAIELSADVPLIIGSTREEMAAVALMWNPNADQLSMSELPARLTPFLGSATEKLLASYREIYPKATAWDLFTLMTADMPTRINSIRTAEKRNMFCRAKTYMYRVDWQAPIFGGRMKAPHGIEVPLVFRNVSEDAVLNGGRPDATLFSDQISEMWIAFARTGNPSTADYSWPSYSDVSRDTMIFDRNTRVEHDPGALERRIFNEKSL